MRFGKLRLATGPEVHYAEQGDGNGAPIVFLHGWPDSWFSFTRVAERIPATYRVFLLDQRGFGESDRPLDGYAIRDFANDAAAFLDALSLGRATIVGHSFGTFVARALAIARPDRVERLALVGTGWTGSNEVTRDVLASLEGLTDPVSEEFARGFQRGTLHAPVPEEFFDRLVTESLKLPAPLWRGLFESIVRYDDTQDLSRIRVPALIMWGDHDALFGRDDQQRVAAAISDARLQVYTGIGHCPNWECPDRVAEDLMDWITVRRSAPPQS
jgi:pimeloyl-ACP methyl ester carboxylesterase